MVRDQRRLAAIVSTDVAGYSRLMGQDDSDTLARLKAHRRELIDPKIAEYGGRIVKTTGDGLLLEFPSVVDAVRCAVDIQRGMAERNAGVPPGQRIDFRIGINVGDIIIDGDDIYGDGVNVAARVQTLAEPGGICASKVVRDQVLDKLSFTFEDLGPQQVKNIARPVEVYRVDLGSGASPTNARGRWRWQQLTRSLGRRWLAAGAVVAVAIAGLVVWVVPLFWKTAPAPTPPPMSIAILPFASPAGSAADEQFADALTQGLTTALGRWRIAKVASLGLMAAYKGRSIDPRSVGRELNVRYLVEGEVRTAAEKVTVTVRLIDAGTGIQAWNVQQELSQQQVAEGPGTSAAWLASRLRADINTAERQRAARMPKADATPLDLLLRADALYDKDSSPKGSVEARRLLDEALRLDPDFVPAMISHARFDLGELYGGEFIKRERFEQVLQEADMLTKRALELDPDAAAWHYRSQVFARQQRWGPALEANAVSLRLDPTNSSAYTWRALMLLWSGQAAASLPLTDKAIALDPLNSGFLRLIECHVYLMLDRADDAIAACEKSIGQSDDWGIYLYLAAAYAQKGETGKAVATQTELLKRKPDVSIASLRALFLTLSNQPVFQQQTEDHVIAGLRKAGIPEK